MDLTHLSHIAIKAARTAGAIIQQHRNEEVEVEKKDAGSELATQVVTAVDRACETAIISHLLPTCEEFNLALLTEESEDDGSRFEKDYFWCVDPMDGTLAFIQKRPGFSVSIALVAKDGTPCIGVVYDPGTDTLYHAVKGKGAFRNGQAWEIRNTNEHLTYVTDKKLKDTPRASDIETWLTEQAEKRNLKGVKEIAGAGSVMNAIRVLEQGPACMLKHPKQAEGGGSLWDFAATACIFHELNLTATTFEGDKLDLNREEDSFMNEDGVFYGNLE